MKVNVNNQKVDTHTQKFERHICKVNFKLSYTSILFQIPGGDNIKIVPRYQCERGFSQGRCLFVDETESEISYHEIIFRDSKTDVSFRPSDQFEANRIVLLQRFVRCAIPTTVSNTVVRIQKTSLRTTAFTCGKSNIAWRTRCDLREIE